MTKKELVELVKEIMSWQGTEEELSEKLFLLKQNVPHPSPSNLIYWDDLTLEEVVDRALSYKPIAL
jgi:hypothetical protein